MKRGGGNRAAAKRRQLHTPPKSTHTGPGDLRRRWGCRKALRMTEVTPGGPQRGTVPCVCRGRGARSTEEDGGKAGRRKGFPAAEVCGGLWRGNRSVTVGKTSAFECHGLSSRRPSPGQTAGCLDATSVLYERLVPQ